MSDEQTPRVEEIKERLKIEIPVEEEAAKAETTKRDVSGELKDLGRQFVDTLQSAWNSEERLRVEGEVREGVKSFVNEVDKAIREAKESQTATKVREEAVEIKIKLESGELGRKSRDGLVQGLQWLSEELGKLAGQFAPAEKAAEEADTAEENE